MAHYLLFGKFKYGTSQTGRLSPEQVTAEYQKRLAGISTVVTSMFPTLLTRDGLPEVSYPVFFVETRDINSAVATVHAQSRKITQIANNHQDLPPVAQAGFINALLLNEIYFTNEIEGVRTDREEIGTLIGNLETQPAGHHQRRLESTVRMYQDTIAGRLLQIKNLPDFRIIYDTLLAGEIDSDKLPDGELFRASPVYIGTESSKIHQPPASEKEISTALAQLIPFMNDDALDPVLKAIVTHFMFENTHPFLDGNGRTGRYLLASYLANKFDIFTGLSVSTAIHEHVKTYYRIFREADQLENRGELTLFVQAMLTIIIWGQRYVLDQLNDRQEQLAEKMALIRQRLTNLSEMAWDIVSMILQSDLFNNEQTSGIQDRQIVARLNPPYAKTKIKTNISALTARHILVQVNGKPLQHVVNPDVLKP
ncbi:Fic family protein [Schleiferilactobacillus shenzhenensis]|uniref:Fic family protein n=1 Tax=Schleiferilactobacillus shenzhenensis TaxID=1231337 RepID=UPI0003F86CFB|nr:Fic family protein [Schleiferilactobacillus shenzhenensis]